MSLTVKETVDPRNLSINITASSGQTYRWGPDEKDAPNVPNGITIASRIPGGFATLDCNLVRRPDLSYHDMDRFARLTCTGGSGSLVAFDGYLSSRPMNRSTTYSFSPEAIGWSGNMKDDPSFSMVYIDRQLSKWEGPTTQRTLNQISAGQGVSVFSAQVTADPTSGNPGILFQGTGALGSGSFVSDQMYDSGAGNLLQYIQYSTISPINTSFNGSFGWYATIIGSPDDVISSDIEFRPSGGAAARLNLVSGAGAAGGTPGAYRYGFLEVEYSGSGGGTDGETFGWIFENPAVIGNHGLAIQLGPSQVSPGTDDGFFGWQIIADIIKRAAVQLNYTTGANGSIYEDNFVIPQMAFNAPTDADTAVQQVNQYYLYDYGVYENKTFFWRPPGTGRQWHVRVGEGAQLTDQGPQIETAFNGVIVQYTDPAGDARVVGPPGTGFDTTSSVLRDTSSSNPCNAYNRKRWATVQMGTTTSAGAITVGEIFLQTTGGRPSSGTATITGYATDSNGRQWPTWMMRAGDTVIFDDTNDQTPRYILEADYNHDSLQNTLTLDAPPNKLDWILQRLGLVIAPLG